MLDPLRARGQPLVVALNKSDKLPAAGHPQARLLARRLALPVVPISARTGANVVEGLLPQLVTCCPALALPLGRDLACYRRQAARYLTRTAALRGGLVGLEPVPLLDLPVHLLLELRLVRDLARLYGQASGPGSVVPREWLVGIVATLLLRYAAQQAAKLVPGLGWAMSGLLALVGTWLLGWGLAWLWARDADTPAPAAPSPFLLERPVVVTSARLGGEGDELLGEEATG